LTASSKRIIFAGSPEFAVPVLEHLANSAHDVIAVLTQPDRPAGRGRHPRASPVKEFAVRRGIEVLQPVSLKRDAAACEEIRRRRPDLLVVVAYGLILPRQVLEIPARGCVNIHASLLPRWRGAAPVQAALLAGDPWTGVTLMQMEVGLDTGPIIAMKAVRIGAEETAGDLHDRLAVAGAGLLDEFLEAMLAGAIRAWPQPGEGARQARRLTKSDAVLHWTEAAARLDRQIRAYNPWPVAETTLDGAQLRCWLARPLPAAGHGVEPGTVIASGAAGLDVQTGDGVLRLTSVQLAGRQRLPAGEFAHGHALPGKVLGA
jgi:methionyl-tRNA formyltransferase